MTGRKKFIEWLGAIFAVMLGITVLSRAADSMTVAEVITKVPQNQVITHKVTGSGKVEGTSERALFALAGLRVERVLAKRRTVCERRRCIDRIFIGKPSGVYAGRTGKDFFPYQKSTGS